MRGRVRRTQNTESQHESNNSVRRLEDTLQAVGYETDTECDGAHTLTAHNLKGIKNYMDNVAKKASRTL